MFRRIAPRLSALLVLACSPTAMDAPDAGAGDAGTDAAPAADAGSSNVEAFATLGATSEGIALGRDPAGTSVLYVGVRDGRIVRVAADGTVSDFVRIDSPVGISVRPDGALLVCASAAGAPGIFEVTVDGVVTPLVTSGPGGAPFTLTNFVAPAPDGSFVFTDSGANQVFRADADGGGLALVTDTITYPNGLAFSADGATLYVASWDTTTLYALSFDAASGAYGTPTATLTDVSNVDGVVATSAGLVLVTSTTGVLAADPTMPSQPRTTLATRGDLLLPANGVFGDATFGPHELFLSSLGRPSVFVIHTDLSGVP